MIYLNKQSNDGDSMRLPHSLINTAKQSGVPVDQMKLVDNKHIDHITQCTSVQTSKDIPPSPLYLHGIIGNEITNRHRLLPQKNSL